jgi:4-hydroxy-tetrahydrodipicolinate synthase
MSAPTSILSGVTAPMVTPMSQGGRPDAAAAAALIDRLDAAGVDRLMLLGSNGEGALIPPAEAAPFARDVATEWRSRRGADASVLVTAFGAGTRAALDAADALLDAAPTAIVVAPPLYFRHTDDELFDHVRAVAAIGVPIIIYNIPRYSGNPISPQLLERLADLDDVVGLKDSGGGTALIECALVLRDRRPGALAVSQGAEGALAWALHRGADGITPGLANLAPELCVALVAAMRAGDEARADVLQHDLDTLTAVHRIRPGVAAMKAALHLLDLVPNEVAPPFRPFDADELVKQRAWLDSVAETIARGDDTR